jgi:cell division ATPase FtsA
MKGKSANYVVFDIGSNKVAAIATNINKTGESTIVAQVLQYSNGFKASTVINLEAAENSIIAAIYSLEKECDEIYNVSTLPREPDRAFLNNLCISIVEGFLRKHG